jgi:hypothetical protein
MISKQETMISYKFLKKSRFYGLLSVLLVSSGCIVTTSVQAQDVLNIFRQLAPANIRQVIPNSTPNASPTSAPRAMNQSEDPNVAIVYYSTTERDRKSDVGRENHHITFRLLQCTKIPNSKNLPGYPRLSSSEKISQIKIKSMVCNFTIESDHDITADFGIGGGLYGSNGEDFRGNIIGSETMVIGKDVEHRSLPVQIVKNKPFTLTTYFRYKETNKQITPLRSLRLDVTTNGYFAGARDSATFKNVSVGEEK